MSSSLQQGASQERQLFLLADMKIAYCGQFGVTTDCAKTQTVFSKYHCIDNWINFYLLSVKVNLVSKAKALGTRFKKGFCKFKRSVERLETSYHFLLNRDKRVISHEFDRLHIDCCLLQDKSFPSFSSLHDSRIHYLAG